MEGQYEQPPDFRRFALSEAVFSILTSIKAGLFITIVTAFVLDAMSDLYENTETKLLRILVEQSVTNSTIEIPSSKPPSSILTVSTLWFLSIMSSLAATTWAIICLEWCAFLPDGIHGEDYEEMAEERHRKYEAVKRWKMHLIVAAIPSFLHLSLFLFLVGLWLRLREVSGQLALIVGVPGLIIALSYVAVSLLPIFTDAPFSTSASELIKPVFDRIMGIPELGRFFSWIAGLFLWVTSPFSAGRSPQTQVTPTCPPHFSRLGVHRLIVFTKRAYNRWKPVALLPIFPTFKLDQNPFNVLDRLKLRRTDLDQEVQLRALSWLIKTPLSGDEVKGVLKEFKNLGDTGKSADCATIRLLVLSLSSILEGNCVSKDEQPIFDRCTRVLAEEMDQAFGDEEHYKKTVFRNAAVCERLLPHFRLAVPGGDDYWKRAIPALWLCPSTVTVRNVVDQLNLNIQSMRADRLRPIVRGLHAALFARFDPSQLTLELIPDFSRWSWDSGASDRHLDKALSGFLQSLFATFYTDLQRPDKPTTTPSLIIDCLNVLDEDPQRYTPKLYLHSALCFFVVVMQRSYPKVFEEGPSVARALLESAKSCGVCRGQDDSGRAKLLTTRLRAISYGPKPSISRESHSLKTLGDLYAELPDSIKTNLQCHEAKEEFCALLEGLLDANAATLEATLAVGSRFVESAWKGSPDYQTAQDICIDSSPTHKASFDFVRQHTNVKSRLPYLYSLAIALSYGTEGRKRELWRVADLLVTHDSLPLIALDRALDTNILVVTVLRFALSDQLETVEEERKGAFLKLLRNIAIGGDDWRTRWKSIYLIADLACLLSRMSDRDERDEKMKPLIDVASGLLKGEGLGCVPSDWEKKKEGLALCELETKVKDLVNAPGLADEGVYEWSGRKNVPFLSLYGSRRIPTELITNAPAHWALTVLRRYVQFLRAGPF